MNERRKADRIPISQPIIYVISNSRGQVETQGIGLALDISEDGMMFESSDPIEAAELAVHASRDDGGTIKIEGFIVYSMPHADGKYRSGIRFSDDPDRVSGFVTELGRRPV